VATHAHASSSRPCHIHGCIRRGVACVKLQSQASLLLRQALQGPYVTSSLFRFATHRCSCCSPVAAACNVRASLHRHAGVATRASWHAQLHASPPAGGVAPPNGPTPASATREQQLPVAAPVGAKRSRPPPVPTAPKHTAARGGTLARPTRRRT
jgi:hypothetical protein